MRTKLRRKRRLLLSALGLVARGQLFHSRRERKRRQLENERTRVNQIKAVAIFGLCVQSLAKCLFYQI